MNKILWKVAKILWCSGYNLGKKYKKPKQKQKHDYTEYNRLIVVLIKNNDLLIE